MQQWRDKLRRMLAGMSAEEKENLKHSIDHPIARHRIEDTVRTESDQVKTTVDEEEEIYGWFSGGGASLQNPPIRTLNNLLNAYPCSVWHTVKATEERKKKSRRRG